MALGAVAGLAGAYLASRSASDQADAMRGATQEQIDLQREQFDYARDLQEQLLQQQAPAREASQRATRSLSMMAGLGDPGSVERQRQEARLGNLQDQLTEADKFITTGGENVDRYFVDPNSMNNPRARGLRNSLIRQYGEDYSEQGLTPEQAQTILNNPSKSKFLERRDYFTPEDTKLNPEFQRLEEEISTLEQELGGEMPGDQFDGPMDVTDMPGYQFALDQGQEALSASGAARGMQLSGNQMQDITKFGQGTAMQFRGQLIDQLAQVAGLRPSGQTQTNLGNLAIGQGQALSGLAGQMGQISAAETAGKTGALGSALANIPWEQFGQQQQQPGGYAGVGFQQAPWEQQMGLSATGGSSGRTF